MAMWLFVPRGRTRFVGKKDVMATICATPPGVVSRIPKSMLLQKGAFCQGVLDQGGPMWLSVLEMTAVAGLPRKFSFVKAGKILPASLDEIRKMTGDILAPQQLLWVLGPVAKIRRGAFLDTRWTWTIRWQS